jgi:DNA-binding GntR family transcriptional regulator
MVKNSSLADYISGDLASQVARTGEPPCKLTLSAIAAHYGVSLSPVRTAVERLVQEGYLDTLENGRLALGKPRRRSWKQIAASPVSPPIDHDKVIQSDVIRLSLQGQDGFLREQWATERYGIGRTALRPILSRLAGQGLIERVPRRGWRIRPFDKDDLCSFIEIRELLELRALRLARPHLESDKLQYFLKTNQSPKSRGEYALNNQLHDYWINLSGNHYIRRFFQRDALYYRALFDYAAPEARVVKEMAMQHCAVLEALLDQRWAAADKALSEHIRAQKPIIKSLVETLHEARK